MLGHILFQIEYGFCLGSKFEFKLSLLEAWFRLWVGFEFNLSLGFGRGVRLCVQVEFGFWSGPRLSLN